MELGSASGGQEIPYSRFLSYLEQKRLTTVELRGDHIAGVCVTDEAFEKGVTAESLRKSREAKAGETSPQRSGEPSQIFLIRTAKIQDGDLISRLHEAEVEFGGVIPSTLSRLTPILIPLGIIVLIFFLLSRRMNNMSGRLFNVGKSKARLVGEKDTGVSFEDVAAGVVKSYWADVLMYALQMRRLSRCRRSIELVH